MSYTALARKWRPRRFSEMVGQEHVRKALVNALTSDRVHHAFLFTGTRGVGKTTVARILAKCLNCETGVTAEPCGVCAACREIDEGRFVDLMEVDAASRTKVDDTRELLDNVQYLPTRGRYKVYLIDEVHMLSTHSFNALLKTLEEPPPHVKFLLATTDPQKLPVTVLSRCLQFNLKRLAPSLIAERMAFILGEEKIDSEPAALQLVSRAADGSLRDALSLLDQLIAYSGAKVTEVAAREMLGTVDRDRVGALALALASGEASGVLEAVRVLDEWAPDHAAVLDDLASLLVRVALRQAVSDYEPEGDVDPAIVQRLASEMSREDVQLAYQAAILGRRDLPLAPDARRGFEMTLLRMLAFRVGAAGAAPERAAPSRPVASTRPVAPATVGARDAPASVPDITATPAQATASASAPGPLDAASWSRIVATLDLQGVARQLATHTSFIAKEGSLLRLGFDARHQAVRTRAQEERLAQALSRHLGETVKLQFEALEGAEPTPAAQEVQQSLREIDAARAALAADPSVRTLQERFGATLHPDTVRPARK